MLAHVNLISFRNWQKMDLKEKKKTYYWGGLTGLLRAWKRILRKIPNPEPFFCNSMQCAYINTTIFPYRLALWHGNQGRIQESKKLIKMKWIWKHSGPTADKIEILLILNEISFLCKDTKLILWTENRKPLHKAKTATEIVQNVINQWFSAGAFRPNSGLHSFPIEDLPQIVIY